MSRTSSASAHLARWSRTIRVCQPGGYAGLIMLHGFALLSIHLLLFGVHPILSPLWAAVGISRITATAWMHGSFLGGRDLLGQFLLVPLSDVVSFIVWLGGFPSRTVLWRGERYQITLGGRLVPSRHRAPVTATT